MDPRFTTIALSLVTSIAPIAAASQIETPPPKARDQKPNPDSKLTSTDRAVIETVLTDLITFKDFPQFLPRKSPPQSQIVLLDTTIADKSGLTDDILNGETRQKFKLPQEILPRLRARNRASVSLASFSPKNSDVLVTDSKTFGGRGQIMWFFERYPKARGFARIYLPAYSADGNTAVFRCQVGPAHHGGAATYVLKKRDGRWQVESRGIGYYK